MHVNTFKRKTSQAFTNLLWCKIFKVVFTSLWCKKCRMLYLLLVLLPLSRYTKLTFISSISMQCCTRFSSLLLFFVQMCQPLCFYKSEVCIMIHGLNFYFVRCDILVSMLLWLCFIVSSACFSFSVYNELSVVYRIRPLSLSFSVTLCLSLPPPPPPTPLEI